MTHHGKKHGAETVIAQTYNFLNRYFLSLSTFVMRWILYLSLLLHHTAEVYSILILSICSKIYLGICWLKNTSSWMDFAQTELNSYYTWQHKLSSTYPQGLKRLSFPGEAEKQRVIKVGKHRLSQRLKASLAERYKKCVYTDKAAPRKEKLNTSTWASSSTGSSVPH